MKNKYDSSIVFLYATGNEHLLPEEFRKQIPYTTIFNWRRTNYDKYLGHEFRYFFDDAFENAELKYHYSKMKRTMGGFARSWVLLSKGFLPLLKSASKDKEIQKNILLAINYMQGHIGLDPSAADRTGLEPNISIYPINKYTYFFPVFLKANLPWLEGVTCK